MNAIINSFGYAGRIFSNKTWNYIVVPKCASSIIINTLSMKETKKKKAKPTFTFIRLPMMRLRSYLFQENCYTEQEAEEKIKSIISNFDNFNEHCVPYSLYIKKNDFNFIGTLENFDDDFTTISDIKIKKESRREDDLNIQKIHDIVIKKYSNDLSRLYSGDFALYSKVTK
tara:strand:+ start:594 stop:1106 length:513 start_codon:yes stop_codon:yes gene_type:complete